MQYAYGALALAAAVHALPQGVTSNIPPSAPAPQGCMPDYPGQFQITVRNVTTSAAKVKRQASTPLEITLAGGVLKDAQQRTGYIASNYQFQFDGPPQAGAIYTSGFSVCGNGSLALGGSAVFYQCYSGGFYNLYDRHWAAQCNPIYIEVIGGKASGGSGVSAIPDGQPQAGTSPTVAALPDGQPQATAQATAAPVGQIGDGQIQNPPMPIAQIGDGQVQMPTAPVGQIGDGQIQATPVGQIGDGQVQATPAAPSPPAAPVGQIGDGQIQASSAAAPVGQIGDGQIQATSAAAPVGQIGDGQVQATPAASPVGQIPDGQVQATSAASPVVQIGDGQVQQAASATSANVQPAQFSGAAVPRAVELPAAVAGVLAALALL